MEFAVRLTEVSYTVTNVLEALPSVCIFLACALGASFVLNLMLKGVEYVLMYRYRCQMYIPIGIDSDGKHRFYERQHQRTWSSFFRAVTYTVLFFGIGLILWTSAAFMGANILTMSATGLILSVVITYSFMDVLRLLGSGYFHCFIGNVDLGEYLEFEGQSGYDGFLVDMFFTYAVMARWDDEKTAVDLINVPITDFLNKRVKKKLKLTNTVPFPLLTEEQAAQKHLRPAAQPVQPAPRTPPPQTMSMTSSVVKKTRYHPVENI